jgi:outer membrane protein OmpA-like peptidoglycan-associated protein
LGSWSVQLTAQTYTTYKTAVKKPLKFYTKAKTAEENGDRELAKEYYLEASKQDPTFIDAYIKLGDLFVDQSNFPAAIKYYESAYALDSNYLNRLHYALGYMYYELDHFERSVPFLKRALTASKNKERKGIIKDLLARAQYAVEAIKHPVPFKPIKLPPTINSSASEYLPSFTANGEQLVYTVRRPIKEAPRVSQEDLFFSEKVNGQWQAGRPIIGINTPFNNEGAQTMTTDGRILVFTGCDDRGQCDLFISYKQEDYWGAPINMGRHINSNGWDAQPALSANGKYLFFASTRNSKNGSDIYVSFNRGNGQWSAPQNLGPTINTPGDDKGPFFHPDGRTLYFVSDGHLGLGRTDLFKSTLLGDGKWAPPMNLGYPINTNGEESTLIVSLDGKTGYFASNRENPKLPFTDIYSFELYEEARPNPVTYLEATVVDAVSKEPLIAKVELFNPDNEAIFYAEKTNREGKMLTSLAAGNRYGLSVEKENYLFHSENFDLIQASSLDQPFQLYIELQAIQPVALIEEGEAPRPVILRNIFFETGSAELLPTSTKELNKLYQLLADNPNMKIRIDGHTDNVGQKEDNQILSENRAKAVYHFLTEKGIVADRLAYKGFGESKPIDTNETAAGRQNNRRTAFLVVE